MIKYDRLWQAMKKRGITQYDLYTHYNVSRSQLNRLRNNRNWRSTPSTGSATFCSAPLRISWSI